MNYTRTHLIKKNFTLIPKYVHSALLHLDKRHNSHSHSKFYIYD